MDTATAAPSHGTQSAPSKGTPATTAIFACLYRARSGVTKQEISRACGISLPTVYQALGSLEERGLIMVSGERQSTGGRRAQAFSVNPDGAAALGISLTGTELRAVACDLLGTRYNLLNQELAMPAPATCAELVPLIAQLARALEERLRRNGIPTVGLGIAVPSALDPATGRLLNTSIVNISDAEPHAQDLMPALPYPVDVFNDADCGAYAQNYPAHSDQNLVFLSLNRGVGGAVLINGAPVPGDRGLSGELGHICVEPGGRACGCGKRGCLEAYCSSDRPSRDLGCTLEEFFDAADRGDARALEVLDDYLCHLARGIQTIHMVLDCPVAIGGELGKYLVPYFGRINELVGELDPFTPDASYVMSAQHPMNGVPLGAAQRMVQRFIDTL